MTLTLVFYLLAFLCSFLTGTKRQVLFSCCCIFLTLAFILSALWDQMASSLLCALLVLLCCPAAFFAMKGGKAK